MRKRSIFAKLDSVTKWVILVIEPLGKNCVLPNSTFVLGKAWFAVSCSRSTPWKALTLLKIPFLKHTDPDSPRQGTTGELNGCLAFKKGRES
jgi:hypothetical protein